MQPSNNAARNASIATALLLLAFGAIAAPSVAADPGGESGAPSDEGEPCYFVDTDPPNAGVSKNPVEDCLVNI
jgi:hypothetical protein